METYAELSELKLIALCGDGDIDEQACRRDENGLAETHGIDDQIEWLDNKHILYHKLDYDPPSIVSVFVLPADGTGKPKVFVPNALSPVVIR